MATENNLPNNDPDLILAKTLGAAIDSGSSFSEINDPLLDMLLLYKENERSTTFISTSTSDSIWTQIEAETKNNLQRLPLSLQDLQLFHGHLQL